MNTEHNLEVSQSWSISLSFQFQTPDR